jgi:hypothetical protein
MKRGDWEAARLVGGELLAGTDYAIFESLIDIRR